MLAILRAVLSIDCSVEKGNSAGQAVIRRKKFSLHYELIL